MKFYHPPLSKRSNFFTMVIFFVSICFSMGVVGSLAVTQTCAQGILVVTFDDLPMVSEATITENNQLLWVNSGNPIYKEMVWDADFDVVGKDYKICDDCPAFAVPHSGSYAVTNQGEEDALILTTPKILIGFWAGQNEYYGYGGGTETIEVHALDGTGTILASVTHTLLERNPGMAEPLEFVDTSQFCIVEGIQAYRFEPAEGCGMNCNWIADDLIFTDGAYAPVPDSGQNQSFTETFGEDSDYLINPQSFTKLDQNGNPLDDTALSWAMVRDNVTGLVWEVKTTDDTVHDRGNRYTWYDDNPETNGGNAGVPGEGTDTEDFIQTLNAETFGGYSDWRLPTIHELASITDRGRHDPAINTTFFPHTQSHWYWSSTTYEPDEGGESAIGLFFSGGYDGELTKSNTGIFVRAVRSDAPGVAPLERFIDNGDETITDRKTGLMFQQYSAADRMIWEDALSYCFTSTFAGFEDWRLPTTEELRAIVDYASLSSPPVDLDIFPDITGSYYWTGTTTQMDTGSAWAIYMSNGLDVSAADKSDDYYVLPVRAGGRDESSAEDLMVSVDADPATGRVPLTTTFRCTVISGTPPFAYTWFFGEGIESGDGQESIYTYNTPGRYTASCTVEDGIGNTTTGVVVITVDEPFLHPDDHIVLTDVSPLRIPADAVYFVYGHQDSNHVIVESGGRAKLIHFPGTNIIDIEAPSTQFTVVRSGATVTLEGSDGTLISLPATGVAQSIGFLDQRLDLVIQSNEVMLGGQTVHTMPDAVGL